MGFPLSQEACLTAKAYMARPGRDCGRGKEEKKRNPEPTAKAPSSPRRQSMELRGHRISPQENPRTPKILKTRANNRLGPCMFILLGPGKAVLGEPSVPHPQRADFVELSLAVNGRLSSSSCGLACLFHVRVFRVFRGKNSWSSAALPWQSCFSPIASRSFAFIRG